MPQFGELLKSLAGKAGIKTEDETLKKMLSFTEVMQQEVAEEFSKPLEQNLLTVESAIANPHVRAPLFGEALGSLDAELDKIPRDLPFDEESKSKYKSFDKNTKEKVRIINESIKKIYADLNEKANKPIPKTELNEKFEREIQALTGERERLNREMEQIKQMHKTELDSMQSNMQNERNNYALRNLLSGKPLPDNDVPLEVNIITAETIVKRGLAEKGLHWFADEFGNLIIKQRKDGAEIDYFVDNKKITASDFTDAELARSKFLRINKDQKNHTGTPAAITTGFPVNQAILDDTQQQLASFGMGVQV